MNELIWHEGKSLSILRRTFLTQDTLQLSTSSIEILTFQINEMNCQDYDCDIQKQNSETNYNDNNVYLNILFFTHCGGGYIS